LNEANQSTLNEIIEIKEQVKLKLQAANEALSLE